MCSSLYEFVSGWIRTWMCVRGGCIRLRAYLWEGVNPRCAWTCECVFMSSPCVCQGAPLAVCVSRVPLCVCLSIRGAGVTRCTGEAVCPQQCPRLCGCVRGRAGLCAGCVRGRAGVPQRSHLCPAGRRGGDEAPAGFRRAPPGLVAGVGRGDGNHRRPQLLVRLVGQ